MKVVRHLLLLVVLLTVACDNSNHSEENMEKELDLQEQGKQKFKAARQAGLDNELWKSLSLWQEAIEIYDQVKDPDQNQYKYYLYRNRANILARVGLSKSAARSMDKAIDYLKQSPSLPQGKSMYRQMISSVRYNATYLRANHNYQESNKILFDLLSDKKANKEVPGLDAQVGNLIGLNFMDLMEYDQAYQQFDDILKISSLKPELRAHYLLNRGKAAYRIGEKVQAFADISQSIGINESKEGRDLYAFLARMELGDLYLQEKEFQMADQNFNIALAGIDERVNQDPDLFRIFNLKYSAELALGLETANDHKVKFDDLTKYHRVQAERFNSERELSILMAGIENERFNQTLTEQRVYYIKWGLAVGLSLLLIIISIVTVLRRGYKLRKLESQLKTA